MKAKRVFAVLLAAVFAMPMAGCMRPIQLNERAIVQAIGVDYENGYRLTLALYDPKAGQAGGKEQSAPLAEGIGATVSEALEDAKQKQGREIFCGQSKLIVVGKEAAVRGLPGLLGVFNDSFESRPNIDVVTTLGKAGDVLKAKLQETPAAVIHDMLDNGSRSGFVPRARMLDLVGALESGGAGAYTPLVERTEEPDGSERVGITGLALYRDGHYTGSTDLSAARGVLWLRDELEAANIAVPGQEGEHLTMAVVNAKTSIRPSLVNGVPHFAVKCAFRAHLSGEDAPGGTLANAVAAVERAGAEAVRQEMEAALEQAVWKNGTDVLGLALLLQKYEPEWYAQNAENLGALLPKFTFTVEVETRVTRYGLQG